MVIKLNLKKDTNGEFEALEPGTYEVIVARFEPRTAGDKNIISVDYEIRSDVEQNGRGRKIRKDDFFCTEKALWKIENASIAAGFTEAEASFEKYSDWAKTFVGKELQVEIYIEESAPTADGRTFKNERVKSYKPTEHPSPKIEVSEDDLPF